MQAARTTLREFAIHIGAPYETATDVALVARKYLALCVSAVPVRAAYAHVDSDYELLELRLAAAPLAAYGEGATHINVPTVVYAFKSGYSEAMCDNPLVAAFAAAQPIRTRVEERWKDAAYVYALVAAKKTPQFYSLVEAIYNDTSHHHRTFADVYEHLKRFSFKASANDIGNLIATLRVEFSAATDDDEATIVESPLVMEDGSISRTGTAIVARYVSVTDSPQAAQPLAELRTQLEPYRKRALLPPLTPLTQVAAQVLLASVGASLQDAPPPNILHRNQRTLTPVLPEERPLVAAILATQEFATPLAKALDLKGNPHVQTLARITNRYEWPSIGTLVQHLLEPAACMDKRTLQRYEAAAAAQDAASMAHVMSCIVGCM